MKIETTIGVDLPKCQLNTAVLAEGGRLVERRVMDTKCRKKIAEYFASYGGRAQVAAESIGIKLRGQNLGSRVEPLGEFRPVDAGLDAFGNRAARQTRGRDQRQQQRPGAMGCPHAGKYSLG